MISPHTPLVMLNGSFSDICLSGRVILMLPYAEDSLLVCLWMFSLHFALGDCKVGLSGFGQVSILLQVQ